MEEGRIVAVFLEGYGRSNAELGGVVYFGNDIGPNSCLTSRYVKLVIAPNGIQQHPIPPFFHAHGHHILARDRNFSL